MSRNFTAALKQAAGTATTATTAGCTSLATSHVFFTFHTDAKYPLNYHCGRISPRFTDFPLPLPLSPPLPTALKYAIQAAHERENCSA